MNNVKILIVEDEHRLSESIRDYLESQHYLCEQAFNFNEAKLKTGSYDYDCVLLDLMLPGGDGLDILREIRKRRNNEGVIIISAKDSLDDRVAGLEIGADDYLPKPFALPELSARIYALIRRKEFSANNEMHSNGLTIDLLQKTVTADVATDSNNESQSSNPKPQTIELTRTEYELLLFFVSNRNKVVSKAAIAEHLSGEMADMMDSFDFIYSHIKNLKAKLAKAGVTDCIKTIYGTGYMWIED